MQLWKKRFVNCHFKLDIQRILTTTWHLRQANHKPCIYTSCSIWALSLVLWSHSFKLHKVKTNLRRVYDLLAIFNISWYCENMQFWHIMLRKKWSPAGLRYLGSAVAFLHFSSHWLPGVREFRALMYICTKCNELRENLKASTYPAFN